MIEFLVPLGVAAISALVWLAYRNPAGYWRLGGLLFIASNIVFVMVIVWNAALIRAEMNLRDSKLMSFDIMKVLDETGVHFGVAIAVYFAVSLFLVFLLILPKIIGTEKEK